MKGPIFAIEGIKGFLILGIVYTLRIFQFRPETKNLDCIAFYDYRFSITSIDVYQDFILLGDLQDCGVVLQFIQENNGYYSLRVIGENFEALDTVCAKFVNNNNVCLFTTGQGGIAIYQIFGNLLEKISEYHVGAQIYSLSIFQKHLIAGTSQGQFIKIIPLNEGQFRKLNALQNSLIHKLSFSGSLNPKGHRVVTQDKNAQKKQILDGSIMKMFYFENVHFQKKIAKSIGNSKTYVDNTLKDIWTD